MAETVRAFIALELNEQVKQAIREFQDQLKPLGCDISWVKPENAHLTLKFLGEVKTKMLPPVIETLGDVCRDLRPFDTTLTHPGVFPDLRHPRVVWVGLDDTDENLARMVESLETALGNVGFRKERRGFQAHITIGRVRTSKNIARLCETIRGLTVPSGIKQSVGRVTLFKSTLTPQGSIYEPLSQTSLG